MNPVVYHKTLTDDDPTVLCDALSGISGHSKTRVKKAMIKGAAWVRQRRGKKRRVKRATTRVKPGDQIWLYYDSRILERVPPAAKCLKDCTDYSIWFKPAGLMSQGSPFSDHCSISRQVEKAFEPQRPVYLIHRLDREVGGLMILAHHHIAASRLSMMMRNNRIEKHYQARLKGQLLAPSSPKGMIEAPLDERPARTSYRCIGYDKIEDITTVQVQIQTGRRHQIRRHFDLIGHPVMGDPRYGKQNSFSGGLQLVAFAIQFECPLGHGHISVQIDPDRIMPTEKNAPGI
jgi:tRNA pseudouridine32 synthase/23S rRNA pseudouridine746 synthase